MTAGNRTGIDAISDDEMADRLGRLGARRNQEGIYTDAMLAERAAARIRDLSAALREAKAYVDRASGTALGLAMSGSDHPDVDGALMGLVHEGMELSPKAGAVLLGGAWPAADADGPEAAPGPSA